MVCFSQPLRGAAASLDKPTASFADAAEQLEVPTGQYFLGTPYYWGAGGQNAWCY
ncbi:MAG: hypothetical protein QM758_20875 [Armatimonas sp.]